MAPYRPGKVRHVVYRVDKVPRLDVFSPLLSCFSIFKQHFVWIFPCVSPDSREVQQLQFQKICVTLEEVRTRNEVSSGGGMRT